jgi:methanogenic corrinoid protein MtbC1
VTKTAGGHRRITIGDAIRFVRAISAPLVRPEMLGLGEVAVGGTGVLSADLPAERLLVFLRDGKDREARGLILSTFLSGQSVAEIADGPIRSALKKLGDLWRHDPSGICIEHRSIDICIQAIQRLRLLVEPGDTRGVALGCAAPGDPYMLPTMLAATALSAEGWHAINLGPDTPFDAILSAVGAHTPDLVWLSVSSIRDASEIRGGLARLTSMVTSKPFTIVIGGRVSNEISLPDSPRIHRGDALADLMRFANDSQPGDS